jgi:hypothetical protein
MASEILGLFTTPEQYQLAQQQAQQAQAIQFANLNPMAQANYGTFLAGQKLGGAIGGALGGEDPQLKMISMRQQLASQLDPTNLDSYKLVAQDAANRGDTQFAMAVADAGREAAVKIAQANKERQLAVPADIQKAQMIPQIQDAIDQYKALPVSPERNRAIKLLESQLRVLGGDTVTKLAVPIQVANRIGEINRTLRTLKPEDPTYQDLLDEKTQLERPEKPEKVADKLQVAKRVREIQAQLSPETGVVLPPAIRAGLEAELGSLQIEQKPDVPKIGVSKLSGEAVYYDRNEDLQFVKRKDPKDPTKQIRVPFEGSVDQTTSNVQQTAGFKQAAGINQNKLDFAKAVEENAFSASDRISLAQSLRELSPKAFTGFAADAKLTASKVASAFGIPTKGGTESEIIDQILGQMTIGAAGQLKGALSDKDVLFLKKTIGTRGLSVNTLLFVADEIERLAAQDRHLNKRINDVTKSGGNLNEVNFEEEKSKSASFVKKQISEYRSLMKKAQNNIPIENMDSSQRAAALEEAKRAKQIRDELGL